MTEPQSSHQPSRNPDDGERSQRVVVVGPDGSPVGAANVPQQAEGEDQQGPGDLVEEPGKVMRIGTMIKQLLEEVRAAPLDDASRNRLREIHETSIKELEQALAPELRDELERLVAPFTADTTPSDAELRVSQAQLVGWLEGLFHGIQTALFAQQMAARVQLEQMRKGLPAGSHDQQGGEGPHHGVTGTGQYL
ncbi:bacterial proteasome activator family protein [Haloechinothrix sp. LS1_15]|uniref:bacterial proteasome activator family protein n=1 Tax=Haloechinothrix sp. LS1_15 TaxID=2652248 RepID=UPI002945201E|nr:bacterial proteasome activator family protein [Haloechinothrix sp. LS1_15]MDV6012388.1 bacterial proteasome activator family protein [Haloechinothrix sp. LS1_15]